MPKRTLFFAATHPSIAEIVTFASIPAAKEAARLMEAKFYSSSNKMKLVILRSANLASNRANASSKRTNISLRGKHDLVEIGKVYKELARLLSEKYAACKKAC